ncbi:flagellar protein FliS [Erwinia typographi]|uniref:Flagellar secretion chaperone FliS n=1 Tax=Erwinia typographi TaxID=371042 RepID=A0A0A3Z2K5_9GAMM|nr:flagellar export chaperone FliS [Erwinia typographi]KGT93332.1 flagellar protein FliS [Erwinia typographi]
MYSSRATQAYEQVSLQSKLSGATSHQLITMLFDGAHNALTRARIYMENNKVAERGEMISKAINIIDNGLRAGLNHEQGKGISEDLERLYAYMSRTLLQANLQNDATLVTHVDELLMNIATAWKEIE